MISKSDYNVYSDKMDKSISVLKENLAEIRAVIRNSENITEYIPEDTEAWNEAYEAFKKIMK